MDKLLRVIEHHADLSLTNDKGQTLLHSVVSKRTYARMAAVCNSKHSQMVDGVRVINWKEPKYVQKEVSDRSQRQPCREEIFVEAV